VDDSFAFRTTVPVRRHVDRRLVKLAIGMGIFLCVVGWFASWVVASERRSLTEHRAAVAVPAPTAALAPDADATLDDARRALRAAVLAAHAAYAERHSFLDADAITLTALQPGFTFVDGPSTMQQIVSVASTPDSWAAAVMGPDGTCLWIRATGEGEVEGATDEECTGVTALRSTTVPVTER